MSRKEALKRFERELKKAPVDMWEQLSELEDKAQIIRPPNTFTALEYAAKRGISKSSAKCRLDNMVRTGLLEKLTYGFKSVAFRIK